MHTVTEPDEATDNEKITSSTCSVSCGIAQGRVLSPTLFNCFVTSLGDLIKSMTAYPEQS